MRNTQLTFQFYEEEKIPKTPKAKYGDIAIMEQTKFVKGNMKKIKVMVLLLTNKQFQETSWDWRRKVSGKDGVPIETLEYYNTCVRRYNDYLERNKVKWLKCHQPTILTKAKKSNTQIGDEIITITKARTTYKTYKTVYDGAMSLKGFFKTK